MLAQNSNASTDLLKMLAPDYINEILLNPVMPLLCLEGNSEVDIIFLTTQFSRNPPITKVKKAPSWLEGWIRSGLSKYQQDLANLIPLVACCDSFNEWRKSVAYEIPF